MQQNADPAELAKFDTPSDDWWALDGEFKPLHDINPLRLRFVLDRTELAGKRVLDVGCGGGIFSEALSKAGAQVTGIDHLFGIVAAEQVLKLLPRGTHDHAKFITPAELARYCRHAGMQLANLSGMVYHPLTRQYRLNDDISVNYLAHARAHA